MDVKSDSDKLDDVILPGFRFHPTDEELVGFYLMRKIQQRPLPIELIKQVDIYKYDPWDLPKLVSTGEKEWYFYCPRDRKYRNSPRPNRVTGAGFWKATGTDRPIYSSNGTKCIGLKKSLVFYRGRAAKGIKTDWMMHEFRLPFTSDSVPPKKLPDKSLLTNDSWAICRIFKKANSTAQRALSHYWVSPLSETSASDHLLSTKGAHSAQFSSENISCTSETGSAIQLCSCSDLQQAYLPDSFVFSPSDMPVPTSKCTVDSSSMLFNLSPTLIGDQATKTTHSIGLQGPEEFSGFSVSLPQDVQGQSIGTGEDQVGLRKNLPSSTDAVNHYGNAEPIGFPFSLPDEWKPNLSWDSPNCTSEMSTAYSTSKCYT